MGLFSRDNTFLGVFLFHVFVAGPGSVVTPGKINLWIRRNKLKLGRHFQINKGDLIVGLSRKS